MAQPEPLFRDRGSLDGVFQAHEQKLRDAAEKIPSDHALATGPEELAAELVEQFRIEPLVLDWDAMEMSHADARIDVSGDFGRGGFDGERIVVAGTRVTFHVPFSGERDLFRFRPSHFTTSNPYGIVRDGELLLVAEAPADSLEGLQSRLEQERDKVKHWVAFSTSDVEGWNARLPQLARDAAERRRQKVITDKELVAGFGVPMRKREDAAPTYAVAPKRREIPRSATPGRAASSPEPFLPPEDYERVLEICRGMATVMEQSPKAFATLDEPAIRHHFLMQLNGQYEGGATGETFNFEGKTDILVREKGRNLFVGECKFWTGPKALSATVDQILGYLAWRDTKAAIFVFNRGRELSKVLAAVAPTIREHSSFAREITGYGLETDFRFILKHRDDPHRELTITILVFEVPGLA